MTAMMRRKLGRSGIEVSAMGLGCWAIGGPFWRGETPVGWGQVDDAESIRAIHRGLELGIDFLDTSDVYGTGHSERVIARALAGRRQRVVIATKFGNIFDEATRQITGGSGDPAYIRQACEASLQRLNTDYIDLYQFHLGDHAMALSGAVRDTLEALVSEGKIRSYGWSTDDPQRARMFAEGKHCAAIQHAMNVLEDSPEMVGVCEQSNLASINRGPLAMGLLTGKYTANSASLPLDDVRGERNPQWLQYFAHGKAHPDWLSKLDAVREILSSHGRTLAQGALAWLWARTEQAIPIPGFRTVAQVDENCGAIAHGALTTAQMREIDRVLTFEPLENGSPR